MSVRKRELNQLDLKKETEITLFRIASLNSEDL